MNVPRIEKSNQIAQKGPENGISIDVVQGKQILPIHAQEIYLISNHFSCCTTVYKLEGNVLLQGVEMINLSSFCSKFSECLHQTKHRLNYILN